MERKRELTKILLAESFKELLIKGSFDKITIKLDSRYYKKDNIVIEREVNTDGKIKAIQLNGKVVNGYFISHDDFVNGTTLKVIQE